MSHCSKCGHWRTLAHSYRNEVAKLCTENRELRRVLRATDKRLGELISLAESIENSATSVIDMQEIRAQIRNKT